jgi:hypothetical protein
MSERILNVDHHEEIAYNGKKLRSKLELKTAEALDALGIPYQYEERKITLIDKFRCPYQKDMVRAITYCPDFIIGPLMIECKGFETPEWKIKKKLIFKWLQDNEPETIFYQIHDCKKQLLQMLDHHWAYLGYAIKVTSKPSKKQPSETKMYDSIAEALDDLKLTGVPLGSIMSSLTGKREYVRGYKFELEKLTL